jgi:hypothetical protein
LKLPTRKPDLSPTDNLKKKNKHGATRERKDVKLPFFNRRKAKNILCAPQREIRWIQISQTWRLFVAAAMYLSRVPFFSAVEF